MHTVTIANTMSKKKNLVYVYGVESMYVGHNIISSLSFSTQL